MALDGGVIVAVYVVVVFTSPEVAYQYVPYCVPVSRKGPSVKLVPPTFQPLAGTCIAAAAEVLPPVTVNVTVKEDDVCPAVRLSEEIEHDTKPGALVVWQ